MGPNASSAFSERLTPPAESVPLSLAISVSRQVADNKNEFVTRPEFKNSSGTPKQVESLSTSVFITLDLKDVQKKRWPADTRALMIAQELSRGRIRSVKYAFTDPNHA